MKLIIAFCWLCVSVSICHAHAVVTKHSLSVSGVSADRAKTVSLNFNSKIEIGLSQVFLVSKGDKQSLLKITKGEQQGQMLVAIPALGVGDYALKLKVFAADGHLTEDVIHFTVTP